MKHLYDNSKLTISGICIFAFILMGLLSCTTMKDTYQDLKLINIYDSLFVEYYVLVFDNAKGENIIILSNKEDRNKQFPNSVILHESITYKIVALPLPIPLQATYISPYKGKPTEKFYLGTIDKPDLEWEKDSIRSKVYYSKNIWGLYIENEIK
jgi:hypothetical protein